MRENRWLILTLGFVFFVLYLFLLWYRPMESWCDEAYWTDWARYLAFHNRYYTTVWGFGHPSYCPLYALVLAEWFKLVGFGFIQAQIPDLLYTVGCYYLMAFGAFKYDLIHKKSSLIMLSCLFWLMPSMFRIANLGRIEMLCLLLGLLTIHFFIQSLLKSSWKNDIGLIASSALLMMTGVEGVVFAVLICGIYLLCQIIGSNCKSLSISRSCLSLMGGNILGLLACCCITYFAGCLHQFFDTMFGFSKTFTKIYFAMRQAIKGFFHGEPLSIHSYLGKSSEVSFIQRIIDAYSQNIEYLVLALLVIVFIILVLSRHHWNNVSAVGRTLTIMAIIAPLIYVLAGRYTSYYVWAAYIPAAMAFVALTDYYDWSHWISYIGCGIVLILFIMSDYTFKNVDFYRHKDKKHFEDVCAANVYINSQTPSVIPYSWYYYVIEQNENIFFQGSGAYPKDLSYVIIDTSNPGEYIDSHFMASLKLTLVDKIGNCDVYHVEDIYENVVTY